MAELNINKSAFGACHEALKALSSRLLEASTFSLAESADTSFMGEMEQKCYDELMNMIKDLADLADETAADVKLTQARYVLADR